MVRLSTSIGFVFLSTFVSLTACKLNASKQKSFASTESDFVVIDELVSPDALTTNQIQKLGTEKEGELGTDPLSLPHFCFIKVNKINNGSGGFVDPDTIEGREKYFDLAAEDLSKVTFLNKEPLSGAQFRDEAMAANNDMGKIVADSLTKSLQMGTQGNQSKNATNTELNLADTNGFLGPVAFVTERLHALSEKLGRRPSNIDDALSGANGTLARLKRSSQDLNKRLLEPGLSEKRKGALLQGLADQKLQRFKQIALRDELKLLANAAGGTRPSIGKEVSAAEWKEILKRSESRYRSGLPRLTKLASAMGEPVLVQTIGSERGKAIFRNRFARKFSPVGVKSAAGQIIPNTFKLVKSAVMKPIGFCAKNALESVFLGGKPALFKTSLCIAAIAVPSLFVASQMALADTGDLRGDSEELKAPTDKGALEAISNVGLALAPADLQTVVDIIKKADSAETDAGADDKSRSCENYLFDNAPVNEKDISEEAILGKE